VVVSNTSPLTNLAAIGQFDLLQRLFTPMGVVGILLRAKQQQLLPAVRPLLDALRHQAGFFLDAALYTHALNLAGEWT
jgi:predicted nucleic acid-binding protein